MPAIIASPRELHCALSAASDGEWILTLMPFMATPRRARAERWSQRVTERSNALDLERGVFTQRDPRRIARSLKRSADRSRRRKSDPYRSAMSMLTFYVNRGGRNLSAVQRKRLESAKNELRRLYGRGGARQAGR